MLIIYSRGSFAGHLVSVINHQPLSTTGPFPEAQAIARPEKQESPVPCVTGVSVTGTVRGTLITPLHIYITISGCGPTSVGIPYTPSYSHDATPNYPKSPYDHSPPTYSPCLLCYLFNCHSLPLFHLIMTSSYTRIVTVKNFLCKTYKIHEFHETCHSVTFIVLVNSHQR